MRAVEKKNEKDKGKGGTKSSNEDEIKPGQSDK